MIQLHFWLVETLENSTKATSKMYIASSEQGAKKTAKPIIKDKRK